MTVQISSLATSFYRGPVYLVLAGAITFLITMGVRMNVSVFTVLFACLFFLAGVLNWNSYQFVDIFVDEENKKIIIQDEFAHGSDRKAFDFGQLSGVESWALVAKIRIEFTTGEYFCFLNKYAIADGRSSDVVKWLKAVQRKR